MEQDGEVEKSPDIPAPQPVIGLIAQAVFAAAACALAGFFFWQDSLYFIHNGEPVDIGSLSELKHGLMRDNAYVKVEGLADPRIQYAESGGKNLRYFILLGSRILVEQKIQSAPQPPPGLSSFKFRGEGRLTKAADSMKYDVILNHFRDRLRVDLRDGGFIFKDNERPSDNLPYFALFCATSILAALSLARAAVAVVKSHFKG